MIYADMAMALQAVTGEPWDAARVGKCGERITNLQRVFSMKCGITAADDKLPRRLLEGTPDGSHAGHSPDLAYMLQDYYRERGWDDKGRPTPEKLAELGLTEIVGEF